MQDKSKLYRQQRVAGLIHTAIISCLERGKLIDIRLINSPLTITKIIMSKDLKIAKCYFVPFNTKIAHTELVEALNNSKYAIRHFVTNSVSLKYSPDIRFFYDYGFDNARIVDKLLDSVNKI